MKKLLRFIHLIILIGCGFLQIWAGYIGIEYHLGKGWAIAALILTFMGGVGAPFMLIGAFFGAMDVWGWHWGWALAFAAPMLAFWLVVFSTAIIPLIIVGVNKAFKLLDSDISRPKEPNHLTKEILSERKPLDPKLLFDASIDGDFAEVKRLLAAGANPNTVDNYGITALDMAKSKEHAEIIRILRAAGAK